MASQVASASRMSIHRSIASFRAMRQQLFRQDLSIGFVPTMGALHKGHLSLVEQAQKQNDVVICSIFVNPTQFGPNEDLDKYPRQMEQDIGVLEDLGVHHLFAPEEDLYGPNYCTYVTPRGFDDIAEGISRPGHFTGVATIVTKLFNIVQPTRAYFGQKDAAQCCLIQRMVEDLNIPVDVRIMDTIREADGLALSSRNAYLTASERAAAPIVYEALCAARDLYSNSSQKNTTATELQQAVIQTLQSEPLVSEIQYVSVDDHATMQPLQGVMKNNQTILISLACKVGKVRLIDNIVLRPSGKETTTT